MSTHLEKLQRQEVNLLGNRIEIIIENSRLYGVLKEIKCETSLVNFIVSVGDRSEYVLMRDFEVEEDENSFFIYSYVLTLVIQK